MWPVFVFRKDIYIYIYIYREREREREMIDFAESDKIVKISGKVDKLKHLQRV